MISAGTTRIGDCTAEHITCKEVQREIFWAANRVAKEVRDKDVDHSELLSNIYGVPAGEVMKNIDTDGDGTVNGRELRKARSEITKYFYYRTELPFRAAFHRFYGYTNITPEMRAALNEELKGKPEELKRRPVVVPASDDC